jgi:hypothetical protein
MSIEATIPVMARHPDDGWIMADLYPLSGFTRRSLDGLVRAICPPPPAPQLENLEERARLQVQRMLRYMHPVVAFGFCLAVIALDYAPIWSFASWRRVRSMDPAQAAPLLERIGWSRLPLLRLLVLGVRGMILSVYFDQDEVHRAIGYAPVPFIEQRIQLRRRLLHGGVSQASDVMGDRR